MKPEGSLLHSQVPATCPCPEPDQSCPWLTIPLPEDPFQCYPPIYAYICQVVSFLRDSPPNSVNILLLHACNLPCPSDPPLFVHHNNIQRVVQAVMLLIMQSSRASHYVLPLRYKHLLWHCSQTLSSSTLPIIWENKFHTHTKQHVNIFSYFSQVMGEKTSELNCIKHPLNTPFGSSYMQLLFVSFILIYLNPATFSQDVLAILMLWFCPAFSW